MKSVKLLAVVMMLLAGSICALGQMQPNVENGFKPYGSYDSSKLDTVNLENGNLMLHIPMPFSYPQRGGKLQDNVLLNLSSKGWMVLQVSADNPAQYWSPGRISRNDNIGRIGIGVGFVSTLDIALHRFQEIDSSAGVTSFGHYITTWDGAVHQLHSPNNSPADATGAPLSFDAVDNSGYHVDLTRPDPGSGNSVPTSGVIIDRQGNRYSFDRFASHCGVPVTTGLSSVVAGLTTPGGGRDMVIWATDYPQYVVDASYGYDTSGNTDGNWQWVPVQDTLPTESFGSNTVTDCEDEALVSQVTDSNGNAIATRWSSSPTDTMGRMFSLMNWVATTDYSGCVSPSPSLPISDAKIYTYQGPGGLPLQVKLCSVNVPLQTNFGVPGIMEIQNAAANFGWPSPALPAIVSVVLSDAPNWTGTRWNFNYDGYLNVTDVALPIGGSIHYDWTTVAQPSCGGPTAVSRAVSGRTVNDNNGNSFHETYSWGTASGGTVTNVATDPLGNDTVHVFTSLNGTNGCLFYETSTRTYQGANASNVLLKRVDTTYSTPIPLGDWIGGNGGDSGIFPLTITTTLANGKVSRVTRSYDSGPGNTRPSFGDIVSEKVFDWGQGAAGVMLREGDTTYQWQVDSTAAYTTANLPDLPASVSVKDGSGCTQAVTEYGYDEAAYLASSDVTAQHGAAPNAVRGNLSSVTRWLTPVNSCNPKGGTAVVSHTNWYDTGEVYQQIDALGHTTTHSYDPFYIGAYSTQTCSPPTSGIAHCVSGTYDFTTGLLTSFTNENATSQASGNTPGDSAHTSNYAYDSMRRLTTAQAPPDPANNSARAQTTFTFSAPNVFPLTVQRQKTITNTLTDTVTSFFDGLGRGYRTQHTLPNGTATVDTTFDAVSRVASVSNPYFSTADATYGLTQTAYDALDRPTQVTKQDSSVSTVSYSDNCTTSTDEAGTQRKTCTDALGRLIEVDEPNPGAAATNATGTITISGAEQTANSQPATAASLTVTLGGADTTNLSTVCARTCHVISSKDTGTLQFTVNAGGTTIGPVSVSYDGTSTLASLASAFYSNFPANSMVSMGNPNGGAAFTLTAIASGSATNSYTITTSLATGCTDSDITSCGGMGWTMTLSGPNLVPTTASPASFTGGQNASSTPDTGTVTVTVNGTGYVTSYGASDTAASIAGRLAAAISGGSWANASPSGGTLILTSKTAGVAGNYAISAGYTWNSAQFTNPSFTTSASGSALTGGLDTSALNNNPFVTLYQYDALGNLLRVDQKGSAPNDSTQWRTRLFTYDSLARLLTASNPESGTVTYTYDADGNLLMKTSPAPNQTGTATQTISYCYDELHRVTGKWYSGQPCSGTQIPQGPPVVSYVYDQGTNAIGKLTSLTDQAGSASYTYDVLGRMATETRVIAGVSKTLSYEYNLDGSLKVLHYPSGAAVTYTPDSAGRMLSAVDAGNAINYVTGATYGPDSALTGFVSGNTGSFAGITNTFVYTNRLQPCRMAASSTGAVPTNCDNSWGNLLDLRYDFHLGNGDNGNVYGITNYRDQTRNQTFTYDALSRLTSAQNAGTDCTQTVLQGKTKFWGNSYGYDAWGNLLQKSVTKCSAENLSVTALANNQLAGYSYDAAGNMTHDATSGLNYSYDQENRITGANGYTYTYDGDGNRVEKSNGSTGTLYWYMAPGIVAESDLSGALKSEYVFFDGERVARRDGVNGAGGVFYYFSDHLKTASVITDAAGNIKSESDYYPWGGELQFLANDSNHYKFTGKERDAETGLDYFGARYYSNELGRFISADWSATPVPVPYVDFGDPQSLNQYSYVRNIPTTNIDADGHCDANGQNCSAWDHIAGAVGGLLNIVPETLNIPTKIFNAVSGHFGGPQLEELPLIQPDEHASQAGINVGTQAQVAIPAAQAAAEARAAGIVVGEVRTAATEEATAGARAGSVEPHPGVTTPYERPSGATTAEQRASVQGKPCVECGKVGPKMVANHKTALVKEYYQTGKIDKTNMRSVNAVNSHCTTCSAKSGGHLSHYSKQMKAKLKDGKN